MTYEEIKEHGLERYFAKPGDICQRLSDGKYVKISEDGHPILLTEEELKTYTENGVVQTKTSNPFAEFDGDVFCVIPVGDYVAKDIDAFLNSKSHGTMSIPSKDDIISLHAYLNKVSR